MNRRKFLYQASCAALGSSTLFSTVANMMLLNGLSASNSATGDYKALVCVLLAGGNDSFNMLAPRTFENNSANPTPGTYDEYAAVRANLALPLSQLLPINYTSGTGLDYGVHDAMPNARNLFNSGNLAFISNVGTLLHPIANRQELATANLPLGLYSHADQIQQWQTSIPHNRQSVGWGGRVADILRTMNGNQSISMNISLDGRNIFQTGNEAFEYAISNEGLAVKPIDKIPTGRNRGILSLFRDQSIDSLMADVYQNAFQQTLTQEYRIALESQESFRNELASVPPFSTSFSASKFSQDLHMIAKIIAAAPNLNMNRQTFFTVIGGWDHHDELLNAHANNLSLLDTGLGEFHAAMNELGTQQDVTVFTISDFGRTMTSNGNGSDHGWGGNQLVMGGAVNGQQIYGDYPSLANLGNSLNVSRRGILIPQLSTDEMFAELALWFGVSATDLLDIFPNINQFYNPLSGVNPIGFMNMV